MLEKTLLEKLPVGMQMSLMKEMYSEIVEPVPFLKALPDDTLNDIYGLMNPMTTLPGQLICSEHDGARHCAHFLDAFVGLHLLHLPCNDEDSATD